MTTVETPKFPGDAFAVRGHGGWRVRPHPINTRLPRFDEEGDGYCLSRTPSFAGAGESVYLCTRAAHADGVHIATGSSHEVYAVWQDDESDV
jgi:hypothetical protein